MRRTVPIRAILTLLKDTVSEWMDDRAPRKGAALAFYTLFSLAPLLVIVIAIAGFVFGPEAAKGEIVEQIDSLVGEEGATAIQGMIESARDPAAGLTATLIALSTLLLGATTVFAELKGSLDEIWGYRAPPGLGIFRFFRARLLSFSMILIIGFLLIVSLTASAALSALSKCWGDMYFWTLWLLQGVNFLFSFAIVTILFAMIYKLLPAIKIAWRDVWTGAAITALLFTLGKTLIGLYLGRSAVSSSFGAAGSLILILLWVYYSTQIFFLGAEFTKLYAYRYGSRRHLQKPPTASADAVSG